MPKDQPIFRLPGRIDSYLATLNRLYAKSGEHLLRDIVVNGLVHVDEGTDYDNWNGGTYLHGITLEIEEDLYFQVREKRNEVEARIASDLRDLDNSTNEGIARVTIHLATTDQGNWREESGVLRPSKSARQVPPDALQRLWGAFHLRVFLSHKSTAKVETFRLKQALEQCGVGSFVAHEDIEPTREWQTEIELALQSMDAIVALLTQDFHKSEWTDQEVGYGIGRGVPLIAIRLGLDPYGLMGRKQGVGGCSWSDTKAMALRIFQVLRSKLQGDSRIFDCAVDAYSRSKSWADSEWAVRNLLSEFRELNQEQINRVLDAYRKNSDNRGSFAGTRKLKQLLCDWTGQDWTILNNELVLPARQQSQADIPF